MEEQNYYDTLDIQPHASQAEIKRAYRRLAKLFHPDSNHAIGNHDRIAGINVAYEVLSDPRRRRQYDLQMSCPSRSGSVATQTRDTHDVSDAENIRQRQQRNAEAQSRYRRQTRGATSDEYLQQWMQQVYQPVNRLLCKILNPLQRQIDDLSADPFDDELLEEFQLYLEDCRTLLQQAQRTFRSQPNPPNVAGVAAHLYYCLNQVGDGIDELERFTFSYDEHYLHVGQELFRIASGLRREAQAAIRAFS